MIPVLYDGGAIDPRRLGKGKLSDIISCVVHEELNGDFSLTFQYPITGVHYDEMTIGSSIIVNMPCFNASNYHSLVPKSSESGTKRDIQVFDIYKKSTPIDGVVTFYCQSIAWRLKDIVYYKSTWRGKSVQLGDLLTDSVPVTLDSGGINLNNVQFTVELPYADGIGVTYTNSAPKSTLSMFLGDSESVVSSMGWDIAYTCIVRDPAPTYPLRVRVYALKYGRGEDYGVIIRHGYRLTNVEYTDDSTDTFNAVVPYWDDGNGNKTYVTGYVVQPTTPITPVKAVPMDCTQAFQTQPTGAQLTQYAQDWLDNNTPWVNVKNITLDFINGSEISGVNATINLGDTVRVYWPAADINIKLRAIAYDYDILAERYNTIELGKQQENFVSVTGIDGGSGGSSGGGGTGAESGNGYFKTADGTLICWGEFTTNRSQYSVTANGAMYAATATVNISFAEEFISTPSLSMLCTNNSCPVMYCSTTASKIVTMQVQRHVNNGPPDGSAWQYIAVGRWR